MELDSQKGEILIDFSLGNHVAPKVYTSFLDLRDDTTSQNIGKILFP